MFNFIKWQITHWFWYWQLCVPPQAYMDTLQTQWSWLLQITKCIHVHLKENAAYSQVSAQLCSCSRALFHMFSYEYWPKCFAAIFSFSRRPMRPIPSCRSSMRLSEASLPATRTPTWITSLNSWKTWRYNYTLLSRKIKYLYAGMKHKTFLNRQLLRHLGVKDLHVWSPVPPLVRPVL